MLLLYQTAVLLITLSMSSPKINKLHNNEMVMSKGMSIQVKNKTGTIRIEALDDLTRKYYWDGNIRQGKMRYRDKRWYGAYGAYSPGGERDIHIVVEEGQQHFCSQNEAVEWLMFMDPKMNYIYTKDGLLVGWYKETNPPNYPNVLSVEIYQIYISGKKPVDLPKAQDSLFTITYSDEYIDNIKIGQFEPNKPKMIGQRLYSGRALDIMDEKRFITPKRVETCIVKGKVLTEYEGEYICYIYSTFRGVTYVTIDKDKRIVKVEGGSHF